MKKNQLTFVNHACFHVANANTLLLIDPWVEGAAFNNGWSLLDSSTSNAALVKDLVARKLNIYIWISHEHPDHFSFSFIKKLKQDFAGKLSILFQHTKDKRVLTFLRCRQFEVIECQPGVPVELDPQLSITTFPHADGKSYCLISSGDRHILNLNDCAMASVEQCRAVKANTSALAERIDVLLTQFGYANWVGNPSQPELRRSAAAERIERIRLQMQVLAPRMTVPFASFALFAHIDNCYLNDHQNSARAIARWARQTRATDSVRFLKPADVIELSLDTPESMAWASDAAVEHWERLASVPCELLATEPAVSVAQVRAAFARHRAAAAANFPLLAPLLELLGLIKPLVLHLPDVALTVRLSYLSGWTEVGPDARFDISLTSPSAAFLFNHECGFNTTHANGRFRTSDAGALARFSRFFMPQNLLRQGYGIHHPAATARYLAAKLVGRLSARMARGQARLQARQS